MKGLACIGSTMTLWLLLFISLAQSAGSAAQTFVARFYAVCIKEDWSSLTLEGRAQPAMRPFLSQRLWHHLDDAAACQADWVRQQPKGSTDKPPFVDCCLFSSIPDGMPTSFAVGRTKVLADGRYQITIDFVRKETTDRFKWRDAVIVIKEGDHFTIDDVVYDVDAEAGKQGRLSAYFQGCRDRRWIGGP